MFFDGALATRMWFNRDKLRRISSRLRDTSRVGPSQQEDTVSGLAGSHDHRRDQQMLWVDGVGGFLICLADEVVLGQPAVGGAADGRPDVPILADLSRKHLRIKRESGNYVLVPHGSTWVDDRPIEGPTALTGGELVRLGHGVKLRFTKPHALSATARLTVESGHRTTPSADAVLLMAESCVLGPESHSHVRCPAWTEEAILFRGAGGLYCRAGKPLRVGDQEIKGPLKIEPGTRIEGQDFAMSVERVTEA